MKFTLQTFYKILEIILLIGISLWAFRLLLLSAWVGDDAFVTFRVVDNFLNGYGLRWNVHERVQAYTNPLWMFLHIPFYWILENIFQTTMALSIFLTIATVLIVINTVPRSLSSISLLMILTLSLSISWREYAVSGLENPLGYFLFAIFGWLLFEFRNMRYGWFWLSLSVAAAIFNRLDMALLFLPAFVCACWHFRLDLNWKQILLGFVPILAWELFSLFYYGFLFPNTKYAKLNTCLSLLDYIRQGWIYVIDYWVTDLVGAALLFLGILWGGCLVPAVWKVRSYEKLCLSALTAGVVLTVAYVVIVGGDFMTGRMFSVAFFAMWWILYKQLPYRLNWSISLSVALLMIVANCASNYARNQIYRCEGCNAIGRNSIADERHFYYAGNSLIYFNENSGQWQMRSSPEHMFMLMAEIVSQLPEKVVTHYVIGMIGFFNGPDKIIIDEFALSDALLARLPNIKKADWRVGHIQRKTPQGYAHAVESGDISEMEPRLATYYTRLRQIISGDLWSWDRLNTIFWFNLGKYDDLKPTCPK